MSESLHISFFYWLPNLIAAALNWLVLVQIAPYYKNRGVSFLILTTAGAAFWAVCEALLFMPFDYETKIDITYAQYLGIVIVVPNVLLYTWSYIGHHRYVTPRFMVAVYSISVLTLGLAWTNHYHHLIWARFWLDDTHAFPMLALQHGPMYWFFFVFCYLYILTSLISLLRAYWRSSRIYRQQYGVLIFGFTVPWIANSIYVSSAIPLPNLDLTPVAFSITGLALSYGYFRYRMFDLLPLAKEEIFNSFADGILVLDNDNRIIYINAVAIRLFRFRENEIPSLLGKNAEVVFHRLPTLLPFIRNEFSQRDELVLAIENTPRYYDLRSSSILDNDLSVLGRMIVLSDVTEKKNEEQRRRQYESQVQASQKLESLGLIAGGIAHDFNNLLTAILGNADLIRMQTKAESELYHNLIEIERAAKRASDLCMQMLAYSGKRPIIKKPLDLNAVIREIMHMIVVSISKKIELRLNLQENLPLVIGDESQIHQVVLNLVTNASEAIGMNSGAITIVTGTKTCRNECLGSLTFSDERVSGTFCFLKIGDTGCGMNPETQLKIFDPFYSTKFAGRGLGMAAVFGIVRSHQGSIHIRSEIGKGSTITVYFPSTQQALPVSVETGLPVSDWKPQGTVLLVDDEEYVRELVSEMLESLGFNVRSAENGFRALEIYDANAGLIDCVILDLAMPQLDGHETCRELRRRNPQLRILISSGYTERDIEQNFVDDPSFHFLQKPYTVDQLSEKLRRVFLQLA